MNINATLIGQTIAFIVFVWFCRRYIWPHIMQALEDRRARISEGLAAAERGQQELATAEERSRAVLDDAKAQAKEILAQAQHRADEIVQGSKDEARVEGGKLLSAAQSEIDQERNQAREELRAEVVAIALAGAEQVLMREVDARVHSETLEKLAARI
jgi:F-type H+-transporting ATPase subunit b